MIKGAREWRCDMSFSYPRLYLGVAGVLLIAFVTLAVLFEPGPRPMWLPVVTGAVGLVAIFGIGRYAFKRAYSVIDVATRTVRVGATGLGASERAWPWSAFHRVIVPDPFLVDPMQLTKTMGVVLRGDEDVRIEVLPSMHATRRAALDLAELMGLPLDLGTATGLRSPDALRLPLRWRLLRKPDPTGCGAPPPRMTSSARRDGGRIFVQPWAGRGLELWVDPTGIYCRSDEHAPWSSIPAESVDDVWIMTELGIGDYSEHRSGATLAVTYRVELGLSDGRTVPLRWGGLTGSHYDRNAIQMYEMGVAGSRRRSASG